MPPTFTRPAMGQVLVWVAVITLLTIVAKPSRGVVLAAQTNSAALLAGKLKQLSVKAAAASMQVAIAGCKERKYLWLP